jgi:hypothetical protein
MTVRTSAMYSAVQSRIGSYITASTHFTKNSEQIGPLAAVSIAIHLAQLAEPDEVPDHWPQQPCQPWPSTAGVAAPVHQDVNQTALNLPSVANWSGLSV